MSINKKYRRLNNESLKGELLINIRDLHIKQISKQLFYSKIFPINYIDENIRLELLKNNKPIIIDDNIRLNYINNLLYKECVKNTSRLIIDLCENK